MTYECFLNFGIPAAGKTAASPNAGNLLPAGKGNPVHRLYDSLSAGKWASARSILFFQSLCPKQRHFLLILHPL